MFNRKNSFRDEGSLFQILLALYLAVLLRQFVETESRCKFSDSNAIEFGKKTQYKGRYAVQGHSRSSRLVPIESPYATFY